jgi:hypothetical protein
MFDFIQVTVSHNLKDPRSKALEPDCLSTLLSVTTQRGRSGWGWVLGPIEWVKLERILASGKLRADPTEFGEFL